MAECRATTSDRRTQYCRHGDLLYRFFVKERQSRYSQVLVDLHVKSEKEESGKWLFDVWDFVVRLLVLVGGNAIAEADNLILCQRQFDTPRSLKKRYIQGVMTGLTPSRKIWLSLILSYFWLLNDATTSKQEQAGRAGIEKGSHSPGFGSPSTVGFVVQEDTSRELFGWVWGVSSHHPLFWLRSTPRLLFVH